MFGTCLEHMEEQLKAAPSRNRVLLSVGFKAAPLYIVVFKPTPLSEISL